MKLPAVFAALALSVLNPMPQALAEQSVLKPFQQPEKQFPGMGFEQMHKHLEKKYGDVRAQTMYDLALAVSTYNKIDKTGEISKEDLNDFMLEDGKVSGYLNLLTNLQELYHYPPFWLYLTGFEEVHKADPGIIKRSIKAFKAEKEKREGKK